MRAARCTAKMIMLAIFLLGLWPEPLRAQRTIPNMAILLYQRMIQRNPFDGRAYYRLGDAYIQKARENGDVKYFILAEQALRKSLDIAPRFSEASRHLAYVLYSRHAFEDAAAQASKTIDLNPADSHAYGILGDAYLEVGKYREAEEAYHKMVQIQGNLYSYSRRSGMKSIQGDVAGAVEDLQHAAREGQANGRPAESIAWVQWQLGNERFAQGKIKDAEGHYQEALKTYPNYYRAFAGLGRVRAAQKRYRKAIDLYKKAMSIIPLPEYVAALGNIYKRIGENEEAKRQYELVEYIGYLSAVNKVLYNRELAYFYADHDMKLNEALELARKELEVRKDIYAYDLLAWALYKNGRSQEALAAMKEALRLGTKDAKLFFHAGMIHYRLGHAKEAKKFLRLAVATNRYFHIFNADVADEALKELEGRSVPVAVARKGDAQ